MNLEDLEDALSDILPEGFVVSYDARGQLIIKTGLVMDDSGELHADGGASFDPEDELDVPDFENESNDEDDFLNFDGDE